MTNSSERANGAVNVPLGWKLVPVEPTNAMLDAIAAECRATWGVNGRTPSEFPPFGSKSEWRERARPFFNAVLAATPSPHRPEAGDRVGNPPQTWGVTVTADGVDILTIESNHLSGIENISDYADTVRNCAQHLLSFIGKPAPAETGGALRRLYDVATEQLRNTSLLMSNPPKSSAAWDIRNAISREMEAATQGDAPTPESSRDHEPQDTQGDRG